jgi:hypothetical protein
MLRLVHERLQDGLSSVRHVCKASSKTALLLLRLAGDQEQDPGGEYEALWLWGRGRLLLLYGKVSALEKAVAPGALTVDVLLV